MHVMATLKCSLHSPPLCGTVFRCGAGCVVILLIELSNKFERTYGHCITKMPGSQTASLMKRQRKACRHARSRRRRRTERVRADNSHNNAGYLFVIARFVVAMSRYWFCKTIVEFRLTSSKRYAFGFIIINGAMDHVDHQQLVKDI